MIEILGSRLALNIKTSPSYKGPILASLVPENTKIVTDLLEKCSKKELATKNKANGIGTIESYLEHCFVYAFTDGPSDKTLTGGGSGINFVFPNGVTLDSIKLEQ